MLVSQYRTTAIRSVHVCCRSLTTKRVPTAIRTRSPYIPPSPPASLSLEANNRPVFVNPRSPRRRSSKMADDPYVVPDSDGEEDDAELALAIQMSLQQGRVEAADSSLFSTGLGLGLGLGLGESRGESSRTGERRGGGETVAGAARGAAKRKADLIVISDTESDLEEVPPPPPPSRKAVKAARDSSVAGSHSPVTFKSRNTSGAANTKKQDLPGFKSRNAEATVDAKMDLPATSTYKPPSFKRKVQEATANTEQSPPAISTREALFSTSRAREAAANTKQSPPAISTREAPSLTSRAREAAPNTEQSPLVIGTDESPFARRWSPEATASTRQDPSFHRAPSPRATDTQTANTTQPKRMSFFGIDRAQMERDRLERLAKTTSRVGITATQQRLDIIMQSKPPAPREEVEPASAYGFTTKTSPAQGMVFARGVVKKTWVRGVTRDGTDVTFEEVLQKETLYGAVFSAYQWDHEWLWTKIPSKKLQRLVMVMQAKVDSDKRAILEVLGGLPKTTVVFPPMEKANCMHSKLMILFHRNPETGEDWLRIAVPSANLTDYDWGERGNMENTVFIIDLPKLPSPQLDQTPFQTSLTQFCRAKTIPEDVLTRLPAYDFSATAPMAFIHSIGGEHYGELTNQTGYTSLGNAITQLGYSCAARGAEVDFVTSSLGATDKDLIMNLYRAAMGSNGLANMEQRAALPLPPTKNELRKMPKVKTKGPQKQRKGKERKTKTAELADEDEDEDAESGSDDGEVSSWSHVSRRFRLYFPSRDTVAASVGGVMNAGTICFTEQWWDAESYPRTVVRDCKSVREGILMHNKMMFVRPPVQIETDAGRLDAWAYVGSANLSESAWGKLVMNRAKKIPKMKCKNWECGVVVPVFAAGDKLGKARARKKPLGIEVFKGTVPVPMHVPSEGIEAEDRKPWFYREASKKASYQRKTNKYQKG